MDLLGNRWVTFLAGIALGIAGVGVTLATGDSAVAVIIVLAGCVLTVYAFVWDRLESFGPSSGLKLRQVTDEAADRIAVQDEGAAADIRAAKTLDELVDRLLTVIERLERPETSAEQAARVRNDAQVLARQERYSPSRRHMVG
jgi:hypothetical protein